MTRRFLLSIVLGLAVCSLGHADIVAQYQVVELSQGGDDSRVESTDTTNATTATHYSTRRSIIRPPLSSGVGPETVYMGANATSSTTNPLISNGFHEFSLEINNGEWDLDTIEFDYKVVNTYAGGQFYVHVYSDTEGFNNGSGEFLGSYTHVGSENNPDTEMANVSIDLSPYEQHQNLAIGDLVEFRLYFGDFTSNASRFHQVDNIVLRAEGSNIPEPTAVVILAGLAGLTICRRKK
ncbi:MAG: hypothetical protein AAF456_04485 [Planctomycetota bacterium]